MICKTTPATGDGNCIRVHGARAHNLKNLSVLIPRNKLVVVTGVSGSGKSTLAFDLLFAEGQRRFLDSMSAYARQFVEQLARPAVDLIAGIPPTVSIEQRHTRGGGKSTVATVTEIYHFLRLLFARLGTQYCPRCQLPVEAQTRDQLGHGLREELQQRGDLLLLAPVIKNRKGFHTDIAKWAARHGYPELRADGKLYRTDQPFRLDRFREHDVEIVVGTLSPGSARPVLRSSVSRGPSPSVETAGDGGPRARRSGQPRRGVSATPREERAAPVRSPQQLIDETLKLGHGALLALDHAGQLTVHSTARACPQCRQSFDVLDPKMFSYNSARGWCPKCRGFGELFYLPDVDRGARADAIEESWFDWQQGSREVCPDCQGARLNPIARAARLRLSTPPASLSIESPTIDDFANMPVDAAARFFKRLKLSGRQAMVGRDIVPEIRERLRFLCDVGLGYMQLGRSITTLSGGEAQRIRLAAQLGSNLNGVLYILDEPTIGLHARDNQQLLNALAALQDRGNSLIVVEHDEETMRRADHIIDLGPGAGIDGGEIVASGTLPELMRHPDSITGQCLRQKKSFPTRGQRRPVSGALARRSVGVPDASGGRGIRYLPAASAPERGESAGRSGASQPGEGILRDRLEPSSKPPWEAEDVPAAAATTWLTLQNAGVHNLKNVTVSFPLGRLVLITGVSGSGKSTLIRECLLPALQMKLRTRRGEPATRNPEPGTLSGYESIQAVYEVDQSPIGRTPRSTPATYVGFFDEIRALFAQTPEARLRGYGPGRFSFNSPQGRCPTCQGAGTIKLEMSFLPPAFVRCETCDGTRFNRETLDIQFNHKNIAQVLNLSVAEATAFLAAFPRILRALRALSDTGLGYLKLGQTSPTLSGGEAQRVKLVSHLLSGLREQLNLFDPPGKRKLFVLEEPTIGLHMADVRRLVEVLQRLVDAQHTVIVIEHNLDLIAEADWVIDLGPEGGEGGGQVVVAGTPEQVAANRRSHTGRALRATL